MQTMYKLQHEERQLIERLQLRTKKMDKIITQDKRVNRFVSSPIRAIIEKYDNPVMGIGG